MSDAMPAARSSALVIGAGAIGTVVAAHLWRAGVAVEVLTKPADAAEHADAHGIVTSGVGGTFTAHPHVVSDASRLSIDPDVVFLGTKAIHVAAALGEVMPRLRPETAVVVMQNGFCDEEVAGIVGRERTISCIVKFGASLVGRGRSRRTSRGGFVIGSYDEARGPDARRVAAIASMLSSVAPVTITGNVLGVRHAKLIFNSCASTLGAICGRNLRGILADRSGREAFLRIATEAIDVFLAMGVRLEPIDGLPMTLLHLGSTRLPRGSGRPRVVAEFVVRLIGALRGEIVSSMLQSIARGEQTEIEYLNGYIVRTARTVGVSVPVNERAIEMVAQISAGRRASALRNLRELCAAPTHARAV
jgi:2-dehydropantoate 2-reductase